MPTDAKNLLAPRASFEEGQGSVAEMKACNTAVELRRESLLVLMHRIQMVQALRT